jgi:hypothetical protein
MAKRTGPNRTSRLGHLCIPDMTLVIESSDCPKNGEHTPAPSGYLAWHEWATHMNQTHRQVRCTGCGRYAVWVRKNLRRLPMG